MLKKGFLKPEISINNLGRKQFWTGILIGVGFSFVLSYFFNYSREALRSISFSSDLFILSEKEFRLYDLFFAAFSTSLGFGFTIIYWLRGRNKKIKKQYLRIYAITNSWFITFIALMIVSRFGSILPITAYNIYGYDNHLDILNEFWWMLILIPIYIFFAQWNTVRLIFKVNNWILISVVFLCITSFYLFKTTYADRGILNQNYNSQNKERFDYIKKEFTIAKRYGIFFSDSTNRKLQKKYSGGITDLVLDLKYAFSSEQPVSLDTLILEKIIIHNMNSHGLYFYGRNDDWDKNWPYALPEDIYNQIKKHDVNSIETKVLFEILNEQATIFTATDISWRERDYFTHYEREKINFKRNMLFSTKTIQSRLIQVLNLLKSETEYEKYHYLLPDLKLNNERGRRIRVEI
jgi:hypothetical protein